MRGVWLMYHDVHVGGAPAPDVPEEAALYHVSDAAFRGQLEVLSASGLAVRTVGDFVRDSASLGEHVAITFDDGWAGSLSTGVESLAAAGLPATFFVTRDFVGRPGFASPALLRDALAAGMELGTHGATHRFLTSCNEQQLRSEFAGSKAFLEDVLGNAVVAGSVPGGAWSPLVARVARETGYRALCTSRPGVNDLRIDPLRLRRIPVRRSTSPGDVERYARFAVGREVVRATALELPRRLLGRERYAAFRARALRRTARG